ncbi:hypothetical protein Tco_1093092 [Tanacetum coccineum]|uniref:Uncharacterized protein n=1 Tax=Tanacetum coccineum TaxID=301880 RepID=A0ABQ5ID29_9ASTR
MYLQSLPQEDEILSAEEQPLPTAASPTADSPGYVPESDPEEEPEEDDEDPEEDPADYPADRDDDDDDDDEDEDEDEEEEEEHPVRYEIGGEFNAAATRTDWREVVRQTIGLSVLWIPRSDDREPRRSAIGLETFG